MTMIFGTLNKTKHFLFSQVHTPSSSALTFSMQHPYKHRSTFFHKYKNEGDFVSCEQMYCLVVFLKAFSCNIDFVVAALLVSKYWPTSGLLCSSIQLSFTWSFGDTHNTIRVRFLAWLVAVAAVW